MTSRSLRDGNPISHRSGSSISLRRGWPGAVLAIALACATATMIGLASTVSTVTIARVVITGVVVFAAGVVAGSERLAALASIPMLAGALLGSDIDLGLVWGRSLIIGCLWYAALEAGWGSIEHRRIGGESGSNSGNAVARRRSQEVAQVVVIAIVVGVAGVGLTAVAPTRTLMVRGSVIAAVLLGMAIALRHLRATAPESESDSESESESESEFKPGEQLDLDQPRS